MDFVPGVASGYKLDSVSAKIAPLFCLPQLAMAHSVTVRVVQVCAECTDALVTGSRIEAKLGIHNCPGCWHVWGHSCYTCAPCCVDMESQGRAGR